MPRWLPVQVEPVGLSNLSVNNRHEKQKQIRSRKAGLYCVTLPLLLSIGLGGKGRGLRVQGCQKLKTFYSENFLPPLGLRVKSELEEVAWLFF